MPFTPSHAVVALPFLRTPLVSAAIAVGAMAPDLPLFLRGMPLHYGLTHSLAWLPGTRSAAGERGRRQVHSGASRPHGRGGVNTDGPPSYAGAGAVVVRIIPPTSNSCR